MYKTQSIQIRNLNSKEYKILQQMCYHSARLYNVALYNIKQQFFQTKTHLRYYDNYHISKINENYKELPSAAAQQTLKVADRGFKSFFSLLKKKKNSQYQVKVSPPSYLRKDGSFQLIYPKTGFFFTGEKINLAISKPLRKEYEVKNVIIDFPTQIDKESVKEIRIIPQQKSKYFKMEIVHEVEKQDLELNQDKILSIDLGLSNLATCYDTSNNKAFIMDGKKIKSINYYWNKQNAKLQSIKDKQKIKGYTERQFLLKRKRENRVKDVMRKTAKYIVDYCISNNIGTIIVGNNKGWKQNINLGKRNNQNFVQIPFGYLMSMLESKCGEYGMRYLETQESHTSKCSSLDNEEVKHHDVYLGKRVNRGMFRSKDGYLINADVNGAINIARKSKVNKKVSEIHFDVDHVMGILNYPLRIRV